MGQIIASFEILMTQAQDAATDYLRRGIDEIDSIFYEGYAEKHPELLAAFINASAIDMGNSTMAKCLEEALDGVADKIDMVACSLSDLSDTIFKK
jgi:hypothetical protein